MKPSIPSSPLQSFVCDLLIDKAILTPPEILPDNARMLSSSLKSPPAVSLNTTSEASMDQRKDSGCDDEDLSLPRLTKQSRWDDSFFVEKQGMQKSPRD